MGTPADPTEPPQEGPASPQPSRPAPPRASTLLSLREPEPFYRQPEGKRLILFGILLALVGAVALYAWSLKPERAAPAQATAAPARPSGEERRAILPTLFEGGLTDTDNGDDFRETPGYRKLIESVASIKPEEVRRRARPLDRDASLEDPDAWRGEFVRVQGAVGGLIANKLERPVYQLTDVWRGTINEPLGDDGVVFDLVEPPPEFKVKKDLMEIEGVFYRTVHYLSRTDEMQTAPYIIARTLRPLTDAEAAASGLTGGSPYLVPAIGAFVLLSAWFLYRFTTSRSRQRAAPQRRAVTFRELFERKLREERARGGGPKP